jgi:hypothetical protein
MEGGVSSRLSLVATSYTESSEGDSESAGSEDRLRAGALRRWGFHLYLVVLRRWRRKFGNVQCIACRGLLWLRFTHGGRLIGHFPRHDLRQRRLKTAMKEI